MLSDSCRYTMSAHYRPLTRELALARWAETMPLCYYMLNEKYWSSKTTIQLCFRTGLGRTVKEEEGKLDHLQPRLPETSSTQYRC